MLSDLLEACLLDPRRPTVFEHPSGAHWGWDGERARMRFQPLDPDRPIAQHARSRLRIERALQVGLKLHGIPWQATAAPAEPAQALLAGRLLDGSFVVEGEGDQPPASLRAHMDPELGLIAVDALESDGRITRRFHPLNEQIIADLRKLFPEAPIETQPVMIESHGAH